MKISAVENVKMRYAEYKKLDSRDKKTFWKEGLINNALYILLFVAIIYTYMQNKRFLTTNSIINILSL